MLPAHRGTRSAREGSRGGAVRPGADLRAHDPRARHHPQPGGHHRAGGRPALPATRGGAPGGRRPVRQEHRAGAAHPDPRRVHAHGAQPRMGAGHGGAARERRRGAVRLREPQRTPAGVVARDPGPDPGQRPHRGPSHRRVLRDEAGRRRQGTPRPRARIAGSRRGRPRRRVAGGGHRGTPRGRTDRHHLRARNRAGRGRARRDGPRRRGGPPPRPPPGHRRGTAPADGAGGFGRCAPPAGLRGVHRRRHDDARADHPRHRRHRRPGAGALPGWTP